MRFRQPCCLIKLFFIFSCFNFVGSSTEEHKKQIEDDPFFVQSAHSSGKTLSTGVVSRELAATKCAPPGCPEGTPCTILKKHFCSSRKCQADVNGNFFCARGSCTDGLQNNWETGVDCGGGCPSGCTTGLACFSGDDCRDLVCLFLDSYDQFVRPEYPHYMSNELSGGYMQYTKDDFGAETLPNAEGGRCADYSCFDGVTNGPEEPDVDCGINSCCGSYTIKRLCPYLCQNGFKCRINTDCRSNRCIRNLMVSNQAFCAAPLMSTSRIELLSRIQGGTTIYGQRRSHFDPQPNINAISFMCDIPADQFTNDAIVDVQRAQEFGNTSYLDVRLIKGYKPGFSNTLTDDDIRRVLEEEEEEEFDDKEEETWMTMKYPMRVKLHTIKSPDGSSAFEVNIEEAAMSLAQERLAELLSNSSTNSILGNRRSLSGLKETLSLMPKIIYQTESKRFVRNLKTEEKVKNVLSEDMIFELQYEFGEGKSHMQLTNEGLTEWESIYKLKYGEQALLDYRHYHLADLSGLATPEMQPIGSRAMDIMNKASSRKLAPGNPPYNITRSDLALAVDVRYLSNVMPYEILLMIARTTNIFNMTLLPGGWAAEHKLVRDLDWYEQDKIYCMTYYNYTIEDFNETNADCSPYIWTPTIKNCSNVTTFLPFNGTVFNNVIPFEATDSEVAMGGVIKTWLNCTNVSLAQPYSENIAFNDLFTRRQLQENSLTQKMPNGRYYPYAHTVLSDNNYLEKRVLLKDDENGDINVKKRRLSSSDYSLGLLRLKPTDSWYMDHPKTKKSLFEHSHAACWVEDIIDRNGQPSARLKCPRSYPTHSTGLSFQEHPVAFRRILYAPDAIQSALNEIESIGGQASILVKNSRRRLQGITETVIEPYNYPKVPPRQSFSGQTFPFSQLVPGVLPNVPRVTYQSMLKFFGTNFDPVAGVQYLTPSIQEGTSKQDGPPTLQFFPSRVHVLVDPRGIPLKPLYAGYPFPQQPVISLIDRHNRLFVQGNVLKDIKVVAFIDPLIFPDASKEINPLKLTGQTQFLFTATGSGTISFFDLGISLPVKKLFINFTATYVTTGASVLVHGATRPFDVFLEPPVIYIPPPYVPMHPILVAFLGLLGISAFGGSCILFSRLGTFYSTPSPRSDFALYKEKVGKDMLSDNSLRSRNMGRDGDDDEDTETEATDVEIENIDPAEKFQPPVPLYNESNLPGFGPSFAEAINYVERQLRGIDDTEGDPTGAHLAAMRFEKSEEPVILAAKKEMILRELKNKDRRNELANKSVSVKIAGKKIAFKNAGKVALAIRDITGFGGAEDRRLQAQREVIYPNPEFRKQKMSQLESSLSNSSSSSSSGDPFVNAHDQIKSMLGDAETVRKFTKKNDDNAPITSLVVEIDESWNNEKNWKIREKNIFAGIKTHLKEELSKASRTSIKRKFVSDDTKIDDVQSIGGASRASSKGATSIASRASSKGAMSISSQASRGRRAEVNEEEMMAIPGQMSTSPQRAAVFV
jgi:hypothetical protein